MTGAVRTRTLKTRERGDAGRQCHGAEGAICIRRRVLTGDPVRSERALEIGRVSEVVDLAAIRQRAIELCSVLANKPESAFAANKRSLREVLGRTASDSDRIYLQDIIDRWFSPDVEALRRSLHDSLGGK